MHKYLGLTLPLQITADSHNAMVRGIEGDRGDDREELRSRRRHGADAVVVGAFRAGRG